MVRVVEQMQIGAKRLAQLGKKLRHDVEVAFGAPDGLERPALFGRLVEEIAAADTVRVRYARYTALRADRAIAHPDVLANGRHGVINGLAIRVAIDHH